MLSKEAVLGWSSIEHVLYEENGHEFIVDFDLFNNHQTFWHRKGIYYTDLTSLPREDIYDAIDQFNKIVAGEST